ncbi:hypothetical protein BG011_006446 [Mortierella polycephala]|uniref:Uncharacterized protein n=1 Tax=Mortierella polycephala TaxID=41804 RepID=A0A9P6PTI2_9FUNG|nr:hypothetical protein BG011_006446 [Mortierella polycephala]
MAKGGGGGGGGGGRGSSGGGSRGGGVGTGGIIAFPAPGYRGGSGSSSNNNSGSSKVLIIVFSCLGGITLILVALCVCHRIRSRRLQNKNNPVATLELGSNTAGAPGVYRPTDSNAKPSMELPLYTAPGAHVESSTPVTYPLIGSTTVPVATANAPSTIAYPDISAVVSQPPAYSQLANQSDGSSTTAPSPLDSSIFPPMPQSPFDASTPNIYPPMPQGPADTSYSPMPQAPSDSASASNPSSYPPMPQGPVDTSYPPMPQAPSDSASTSNPSSYPPMPQGPSASTTNPTSYPLMSQ